MIAENGVTVIPLNPAPIYVQLWCEKWLKVWKTEDHQDLKK